MAGTDLGLEAFGYGANAGDPMGFWRAANNARQAQQLQNAQAQRDYIQQPQIAGAAIAALMGGQGSQTPQPPSPGQPSQPSAPPQMGTAPVMPVQRAPLGAPAPQAPPSMGNEMQSDPTQGAGPGGVYRMPGAGGQPQQPQMGQGPAGPGGSVSGYTLPQMVQNIQKVYPNASPQVVFQALQQSWGLLNTNARQQLEQINQALKMQQLNQGQERLGIQAQRAGTAQDQADTSRANSQMNWTKSFDAGGAPPAMPGPTRGQIPNPPPAGAPGMNGAAMSGQPALDNAALQTAQSAMPGGGKSFAQNKADLAAAQSSGHLTGATNTAREDATAVLKGPAASAALGYLPDKSNLAETTIKNWQSKFEGSPEYGSFLAQNTLVAGEITRALTGGRSNQKLEESIAEKLDGAVSKSQWTAIANSYLKGMSATVGASQGVVAAGGKPTTSTDSDGIKIDAPSPAPDGVDPKVWQFMTPEEKKLWQN